MFTVFLILTAVMNIGLGYGLALYLRRASEARVAGPLPTVNDLADGSSDDFSDPTDEFAGVDEEGLDEPLTVQAAAALADEGEPEQVMLEDIEEFRSELASLKGEAEAPADELQPAAEGASV